MKDMNFLQTRRLLPRSSLASPHTTSGERAAQFDGHMRGGRVGFGEITEQKAHVQRASLLERPGPSVVLCWPCAYYTLVVEWGWGRVLLWPVVGKVLKAWRGCMLVMVLGIMVMVLGVIRGTSSGARRRASV